MDSLKVKPHYLYQQYRSEQWLIDFFTLLDEIKQKNYYDRIGQYIEARDIIHTNSDYLTFYVNNLLGMLKPLGSASVANYWDVGDKYDSESETNLGESKPLVYDDAMVFDGTISQEQFRTYLQFIYNYEYEICNIDYLCRFVAAWTGIQISEIKITHIPNSSRIEFLLPFRTETQDFVKLTINYNDVMGWPKGVYLDFRLPSPEGKI